MCYDLSVNTTSDPQTRLAQVKKSVEELESRFNADPVALKELMNCREKEECENVIHKIRVRGLDYISEELENRKRSKLQPKKAARKHDFMEAIEYNLKNSRKGDDVRGSSYYSWKKFEAPKKTETVFNAKGRMVNLNDLNKNFSADVNSYIGEVETLQTGIASSIITDDTNRKVLAELYNALQQGDCETVTKILKDSPDLINHEFSVTHHLNSS